MQQRSSLGPRPKFPPPPLSQHGLHKHFPTTLMPIYFINEPSHFARKTSSNRQPIIGMLESTHRDPLATLFSWGLQTFGLNLIKCLATHCNNALQKLLHHEQSRRPIYNQLNDLHSPYPTHALLRVSDPCHFPPDHIDTPPHSWATAAADPPNPHSKKKVVSADAIASKITVKKIIISFN